MALRNQVEWALHCCAILAGLPEGQYLATKDLAELHGVPKEYLSKALQNLSAAGIVLATLGPRGGYRLAKPAEEISFLDMVDAIDGDSTRFVCTEIRKNNPCRPSKAKDSKACGIARVMWAADEARRAHLRSVSLADLLEMISDEVDPKIWQKTMDWISERV